MHDRGRRPHVQGASHMAEGRLVPDELVISLLMHAVGDGPPQGFLLDSFPRTVVQADALEAALHGAGTRAPGSAVDMIGDMQLTARDDSQTQMDWKATVNVSGTIASVGARLLSGVAQKLTSQFFDCLKTRLQAPDTSDGNG